MPTLQKTQCRGIAPAAKLSYPAPSTGCLRWVCSVVWSLGPPSAPGAAYPSAADRPSRSRSQHMVTQVTDKSEVTGLFSHSQLIFNIIYYELYSPVSRLLGSQTSERERGWALHVLSCVYQTWAWSAQPFLRSGTVIRHVCMCKVGPNWLFHATLITSSHHCCKFESIGSAVPRSGNDPCTCARAVASKLWHLGIYCQVAAYMYAKFQRQSLLQV